MNDVKILTSDGESLSLKLSKIQDFESKLNGGLILPDDSRYDHARRLWNGMIDKKPGLIVQPRGVVDVIDSVNFAREHNLKLAIKGGGHNVAGHAMSDGGMVIDLSGMRSVRVDPDARIAYAEGGATLGDLDRETHIFDLAAPVGVVSETGIAGLTLHGGIGWQARKRGMTIDNVLSFDVVTAEGQFLKASYDRNPDLFWALRGGGGNFGVVTSFEYQLYPVGPDVWMAFVLYPLDMADAALSFYRSYMLSAPDELMAIAIYWSVPPEPEVPEEFHGQPALIFLACYTGPFEEGEKVIRPLREFGKPIADLSSPMKFSEVQSLLDADYPNGRFYYWKSLYIPELSDELIHLLTTYAAKRPSAITSLDIWSLGGAVGRVGVDETPFPYRKAPFLIGLESNWDDPAESDKNVQWTRELFGELQRFSTGGVYLNFPGFAEEGSELVKKAYGDNYARLREIKRRYDPDNLFRGNLNIS